MINGIAQIHVQQKRKTIILAPIFIENFCIFFLQAKRQENAREKF